MSDLETAEELESTLLVEEYLWGSHMKMQNVQESEIAYSTRALLSEMYVAWSGGV